MSNPTLREAVQTPLLDLLRAVPRDARLCVEVNPTEHHLIPVGELCHQAAGALAAPEEPCHECKDQYASRVRQAQEICELHVERDQLRAEVERLRALQPDDYELAAREARAALGEKPT